MSAARSSRRSWYTASRLVTVGLSSRSGVQFGLSATLDCLEHGAEAVLAGHRQVLVEADRGNEVRLGRHDLARRAVGINPQQHGDDPRQDGGVADGVEQQLSVALLADQPNLRLAALQLELVAPVLLGERRQAAAAVGQVLVAVVPVVEEGELVDELGLLLGDRAPAGDRKSTRLNSSH